MAEFDKASETWLSLANNDDLEAALRLAADSLKEVKAQTEYQDQKATRLLTVTSFVMALAGALFTRLNEAYPITEIPGQPGARMVLVALAYVGFGALAPPRLQPRPQPVVDRQESGRRHMSNDLGHDAMFAQFVNVQPVQRASRANSPERR